MTVPIKSQKEADQVLERLIKMAMDTEKIDREQAEKRIKAFMDSGETFCLPPDSILFQKTVDKYMKTPV